MSGKHPTQHIHSSHQLNSHPPTSFETAFNEATRLQFGTVVSLALEDMPQNASGRHAAMLAAAAIPGNDFFCFSLMTTKLVPSLKLT